MRRDLVLMMAGMLAFGTAAYADHESVDQPAREATEAEEAATDSESTESEDMRPTPPRTSLKVLQNPYDIASFYRSSQESAPRYYFGGHEIEGPSKYPIAGFYRQSGSRGRWGQFWTTGGSDGNWGHYWTAGIESGRRGGQRRTYFRAGTRRAVAASDLCMAAPTVLMPFAPFVVSEDLR